MENENNNNEEKQPNKPLPKRSFLDICVNLLFGSKNKAGQPAAASGKIDINSYKDPEGLTIKRMDLGLWLVEHRQKFKNLLLAFLAVFSVLVWSYTIFGLLHYVVWGMKADEKLAAELSAVVLNVYRPVPDELIVSPLQIIADEGVRHDFVVKVKNPNQRHWAELAYDFSSGGAVLASYHNFILPGEEKYLMALGIESPGRLSEAAINFNSVRWLFVNPRKFPDWEKFRSERLNIGITDAKFTPARSTILAEKLPLNNLSFTLSNQTAYNFYEADFIILLFNRASLVGAGRHKIKNFYSGQSQSVNLTWQGQIAKVDEIYITPEINITRDDIYVRF